jgi:hypothetical protein
MYGYTALADVVDGDDYTVEEVVVDVYAANGCYAFRINSAYSRLINISVIHGIYA